MMGLVEFGYVSIVAVVQVDYLLAVGQKKSTCDWFCDDSKCLAPINNLGDFKWLAGWSFLGTVRLVLGRFHNKASLKTQLRSLALVRAGELPSQPV